MTIDTDFEKDEAELAGLEAAQIGHYTDDVDTPLSQRPVIEAGGGESEGFEESERLLIENASHGDQMPAHAILHHQGISESENSRHSDGEADHEYSSEANGQD